MLYFLVLIQWALCASQVASYLFDGRHWVNLASAIVCGLFALHSTWGTIRDAINARKCDREMAAIMARHTALILRGPRR